MTKGKAKEPEVISVIAPIHRYRVRVSVENLIYTKNKQFLRKVVAKRTYIISASNETDALTEGKVRLFRDSFDAARAYLGGNCECSDGGDLYSDARQIA